MELLQLLRIVFDSGLLILIWMVQLVAYPVLPYCDKDRLLKWHAIYMRRVSYIVMPLMLGQLICYGILLFKHFEITLIFAASFVLLNWILTFTIFVPLHQKIGQNQAKTSDFEQLIAKNWWRTVTWSIVFILTIIDLFL